MYLLTLDRFAEVYFNLKYPLYCTIRRLRYAMILLWSITGFWFIFLFVYMRKHGYDRIETFHYLYLYPVADSVFLTVSIITYSYIITLLNRVHATVPLVGIQMSSNTSKTNRTAKKRNNHLKLPTLLIISFFIFVEIPDVILFCMQHTNTNISTAVWMSCQISYAVGLIFDAVLYVLLSTSLRKWITDELT